MQFQNAIVEELFRKDFRISRDVLIEIKELGLAVEQDLLRIVDDAIAQPDHYTDDLEPNNGGFAPMHAILLLREIQSPKVCQRIMQMLQGDVIIIDKLFTEEFLVEEAWTYICHLGHQEIGLCKDILFAGDADVYARTAISTGLAQMALHYPQYQQQVLDIFQKLLEYILSEESLELLAEEEGIFGEEPDYEADIEFISNFACDLLDVDAQHLRKELDLLYENGLIDEDILEEVNAVFKRNPMKHRNIFDIYRDLEISENAILGVEEEEDEDEPKVKKMKD
jgi:DNA-binding transcriptional ArsR family regulator